MPGDVGHLDADGALFLTGPIRNLITRAGDQVSPEYVEDVLCGCPAVAEAAVFRVPDERHGHRVGAAVVLREGEDAEPSEIVRYCRGRLAAFEVPERIRVVEALPHTAKGALDRQAVQLRFARCYGRAGRPDPPRFSGPGVRARAAAGRRTRPGEVRPPPS